MSRNQQGDEFSGHVSLVELGLEQRSGGQDLSSFARLWKVLSCMFGSQRVEYVRMLVFGSRKETAGSDGMIR